VAQTIFSTPSSPRFSASATLGFQTVSNAPSIQIRTLTTPAEFAQAVEVQKQVWGFDEIELVPVPLFSVAYHVGGQTFGAYAGDRMIGFLLAMPGLKPGGKVYLHSHMLGVLKDCRNRGVGRLLKLRQREDALSRSIDLVEWTFDPLELKNAHFNLERLGIIVRRYVLNQYGTTTSHLHGGLPTDRCVAEWWLESARVEAIMSGRPPARPPVRAAVEVPASIGVLRQQDPKRAREIQQRVSEQFVAHLKSGLAVIGFERAEDAGRYLLGEWPSE
jgi:predicted GNAT superfamily acetyltransferase